MKKIPHLKALLFLISIFVLTLQNSLSAQTPTETTPVDTLGITLCPGQFPFTYNGTNYNAPGYYLFTDKIGERRDSVTRCIHLQVFQQQYDTIRLNICENDFPYQYAENMQIMGPTVFSTNTFSMDTNGCPVSTSFIVTSAPKYNVDITEDICVVDTPYHIADTTLSESGTYTIAFESVNGCDSIVNLTLNIHPVYQLTDTVTTTVCSHDLPYLYGDSAFSATGIYDFPIHSVFGCDSMQVHLDLTVTSTQYDTLAYTLCSNEFPYAVDSIHIYTEAGTHYIVHDTTEGCPSVTTVILTATPAYNDTLRVNICDIDTPYVYGDTSFVESTIYSVLDTTVLGCDSNATLILTVNPSYNIVDTVSMDVCQSEMPFLYADSLLADSGVYQLDIKTLAGCDSIHRTLHLNVLNNPTDTVTIGVCAYDFPFQYQDTLIAAPGEYDLAVVDTISGGCDILRHLIVDSLPTYHDTIYVTNCANVPFVIGDSTLTEAGIYDITLTSVNGCDSIVTVNLELLPTFVADTLSFTICENDLPFHYADSSLYTEGLHLVNIPAVNGCDSITPINLHILPIIYNADTIRREICANELPVEAFGRTLTAGGLYTYTTQSLVTGCDSVFYYRLIVHENPTPTIMGSNYLCDGSIGNLSVEPEASAYNWNNGAHSQLITIALPGTYSVTVTDAYGCQATASKQIASAALPTASITGNQTICAGESTTLTADGGVSYVWADGRITPTIEVHPTTTSIYRVTVTNATPCSREANVTVVVHELPEPIITGNNTICQGDSTELIAGGGQSYLWSTGGYGNRITVHSAGVYTVTVTDENGCRNTANETLTVNSRPTIRVNGRTQFCMGESTMVTASGAVSYEWNSGETTASVTTAYAGQYTVTGTAANGCTATANITLTTSQVTATISGERHFCAGESTILTVTGNEPYSYRWYDGSTTESVSISTAGQYAVTVTNALGCSNTITAAVSEYALPNPTISGTLTICEGRTTILRATGGVSYLWDDGSTNAYISVNTTGTYTVTTTNAYGCSSSTSETVIVNPKPEINILTNNSICSGESVSLYAVSAASNSFAWTSGQNTALINVTPTSNTTYTVLVTDENNCTNTASTTIAVNPLPIPFISGTTTICQGNTTTLTVTGGSSYQWSTGVTSNMIAVSNGGEYTVTATNGHGCSATATTTVTANSLPVVMVTDMVSICQGQTATLTANATSNCSYAWSNGSYENTITTQIAGNYTVTITNSNGCSVTRTSTVTSHNNPQITLVGDMPMCEGESTQIVAYGSENCTFSWSNGTNNALATFFASGIYTVSATNNYGCTNTASASIIVHPTPTPTITGEYTICPNGSTVLTVTNGNAYQWSTGETTRAINVAPNTATSYTVTVTDAYGCTGNTSFLVQIGNLPNVNITGETHICAGQTTQLSVPTGNSYLWSNNSTNSSIYVSTPGIYSVTATNALGCTNIDSVEVVVNDLPQLTFGMQHSICEGQSYTYTLPNDPNITYAWSNNATGNEITVYNAGIYTVTATNQYGCSRSASDSLAVHPIPVPVISGNTSICRGSSTILTATGGTSYLWSNGATSNDIAVFPTMQTTYVVTATNQFGCSAITSATVAVRVLPSVNFTGNRSFCEGSSTTITANGGMNYAWSTGASSNSINIAQPGTYYVTVTNSVGCERADSVNIALYQNPTVNITGNALLCKGSSEVLSATGAQNYNWSTGENNDAIVIMPNETTVYTVTGTDINGCSAVATKIVNVEELPEVEISGALAICQGFATTLTATGGASYVWNNGNTTPSIQVDAAGNYTVVATSIHGCTASKSETVIVHPNPVASIVGANTLCSNQTTVLRATGGDYYHWSNGAMTDSLLISVGGIYNVTVTNIHNCSSSATTSVATLEAPFVQIIGTDEVCDGSSTTLFASSNGQNYHWSTGENTQSINVNPNTTTDYIVTSTNNNGCIATAQFTLNVHPTYHTDINGTICQGNPYTQNGFDLPVQNEAGIFTYTNDLQSVNGCDSMITLHLTVNPLPVMPDTISGNNHIGNYGTYLYSVDGAEHVDNYEWRCSNTNWNLTDNHIYSAFLQISQNGSGQLTARGINACGFREVTLSISCNVSVNEYTNDTQILVYPNPTTQYLNINLEDAVVDVHQVQLIDNNGRCLQTIAVDGNFIQVECGQYATGNYLIRFIDNNGNTIDTRKVIIK
ncbi:MAG: T9SS type A sorting domain-containing protein [Bacteroidales bacterium]|nr:T9SS type A sorting domain-containing protein [Bacteroidales bacterium]